MKVVLKTAVTSIPIFIYFAVITIKPAFCENMKIKLPEPVKKGSVTLEETLNERQSIRKYKNEPLTLKEVGQILWSAQGTARHNNRTAPSAGATYPLEIYLAAGNVKGIKPGLYRYVSGPHTLEPVKSGDIRKELSSVCLGQPMIQFAPVSIIIDAVTERTSKRYGKRAERYVTMEAGHAGQNIYLQAASLGLGTVAVGAFSDSGMMKLIPELEYPLCVFPVGKN